MAFQRIVSSIVYSNVFRPVFFCHKYLNCSAKNNKPITVEFDALDIFAAQLVQKRLNYLEKRNKKNNMKRTSLQEINTEVYSDVNFASISETQFNQMITNALHECNDLGVIKLVQECIKYNICPKQDIISHILYICAYKSEVGLIHGLRNVCMNKPVKVCENFNFLLYEAHAIWMRGNVIKALDIFEKLYMNNPPLKRQIRRSLKQLISIGTKSNSEAVLSHIVKFTENIVEKYQDYHPMMCVWEVCFLSQWFSDQQIALKLLHNNRKLCDLLINRLPYLLYTSLKNHGTEIIYRLLEIMLDFQMKDHYLIVIMALLDYHYLQGNTRSYSEMVKWCKHNELTLPNLYIEKYLTLLLNKQNEIVNSDPNRTKRNDYTLSF